MLKDWLQESRPRLEKVRYYNYLKDVDMGEKTITPYVVLRAIYDDLRVCSYPLTDRHDNAIDELSAKSTPEIEVRNENNWHFRVPTNRRDRGWSTADKTEARISLNVHAEKDLIQKLDAFCQTHKAYYKTPNQTAAWTERHDPITIYFHEPVTTEMQALLSALAAPHIRGNNLHGKKIADGIYMEASPSLEDIQKIIARAEKLHPEIGRDVRKMAGGDDQQATLKLSAGQMRAIDIALSDYQQFITRKMADITATAIEINPLQDVRCDVSTYSGTKDQMLRMVLQGSQEQLNEAVRRLTEMGLKPGEDFHNNSGARIVLMGSGAQTAIADICQIRGLNPSFGIPAKRDPHGKG